MERVWVHGICMRASTVEPPRSGRNSMSFTLSAFVDYCVLFA